MELLLFVLVPFAMYGAYSMWKSHEQSVQEDAREFERQIKAFQAKNPDALISCSYYPAYRYFVSFQNDRGQNVFEFSKTKSEAARRRKELQVDGRKVGLGWLGPHVELL